MSADTVLVGPFVLLITVAAATVPMWVPVVKRRWRRAVIRVRHCRETVLRARRRHEFEAGVEMLAFEYSLSDAVRADLQRYAAVLWRRYELGHTTLQYAQHECAAWVSRTQRQGATS
jgi:hypothetical protein